MARAAALPVHWGGSSHQHCACEHRRPRLADARVEAQLNTARAPKRHARRPLRARFEMKWKSGAAVRAGDARSAECTRLRIARAGGTSF
eukprot:1174749-Pleurochrysis_carterae.AAC.3